MLYRSTDRLCRRGAAVKNLAHSASFHLKEKIAPSKPGIKQVALTRAEFSLLLAFARQPDRVLSRDELTHVVAGRGAKPDDRSVDVLISRLRRKIEPDPRAPRMIVTMPGEGYKLIAKPLAVATNLAMAGHHSRSRLLATTEKLGDGSSVRPAKPGEPIVRKHPDRRELWSLLWPFS